MECKVVIDNDCINDNEYISSATNSYMKKEDLIKILQSTDFYAVSGCSISCITSYVAEKNNEGKTTVRTRGFDIRID